MRIPKSLLAAVALLCLVASGCSGLWNLVFPLELRFEANDGTGRSSTQDIRAGATASLAENAFAREGWGFLGWSRKPGALAADYLDGADYAMGDEDEVLYAVWARNTRSITFHANDGSAQPATKVQNLVAGSSGYLRANTFERSGYAFVGWAARAEAGAYEYADDAAYTMGETDVHLYAVWSANVLTITFRANGGAGENESSPRSQSIELGESAYLRANAFSLSGHAFLGWAASPSDAEPAYDDGELYTASVPGSIELYALWGKNSHAVTFHKNDGSAGEATAVQNLVAGTTAYLRANTFVRTGYAFLGWAESADATSAAYAEYDTYAMGDNDVDLYAVWNVDAHKLGFMVNGGEGVDAARYVQSGFSTTLPSGADLGWSGIEGSIFGGWALSPSAQAPDYEAGASFAMGSQDVTLYALWGYRGLAAIESLNGIDDNNNILSKTPLDGVFELGAHYAGTYTTLTIPLANTGDLPLTISSISLEEAGSNAAFSLSDLPILPYVIPNINQSYAFKLTFTCASADQYANGAMRVVAVVRFKSDDPDEAEDGYTLSLVGYLGSP